MKRNELLRHLRLHGCELLREGARHSWWHNPAQNKRTAIPRHVEISDLLAKKICKDLGVPPVKG
jgi:mRNA interferase HicA